MFTDLESLVARITDDTSLVLPADYAPCAQSAVRQIIRCGTRGLHLIGLPTIGFQADLLIGAGCVKAVETAAVTLGERGPAYRFMQAVRDGTVRLMDATCPAIHAGLQAAEKGIPFMPLRGILGSDLLRYRLDWKVIDNPYAAQQNAADHPGDARPENSPDTTTKADPIVLIPAIRPDTALFHAPLADLQGNVWIGIRRELMLAAHASAQTLVTVERVTDANLLADERYAAGTIPALYVSALAEVEYGAWPTGLPDAYEPDIGHITRYVELAKTDAGFAEYVEQFVRQPEAA